MTLEIQTKTYSLVGIDIKNFRGFKDVSIDFLDSYREPRKKFVITGPQGSGKSTIIDAIQFCGYGLRGTGRMSPKSVLPMDWDNKVKEDQSVTIRLRPVDDLATSDNEVICRRVRKANSNSNRATTITSFWEGSIEEESEAEIKSRFSQIFGEPPALAAGTMWSIRTQEMAMVATSLMNEQKSYYLEFMNLNIPTDSLHHLVSMWGADMKRKDSKVRNYNILEQKEQDQRTQVTDIAKKIKAQTEETNKLSEWLLKNKLSVTEKTTAEKATEHSLTIAEFKEAKASLTKEQIQQTELSSLISTLLSKQLSVEGIEIPESFDSDSFDWPKIADYCDKSKKFTKQNIDDLRGFGGVGVGVDTSHLHQAREKYEEWGSRIRRLKAALSDFKTKGARHDILLDDNIDLASIKAASGKSKQFDEKKEELVNKRKDLAELKDTLQQEKDTLQIIQTNLKNSVQAKSKQAESLANQLIARAISSAIERADQRYKDLMYSETLTSINEYWKKIDQQGKYTPEFDGGSFYLVEEEGGRRNVSVGEDEEASDGESELFLVCCCLALAEKSGSKMPIVLDDCFTKVDKKTRTKLVEVVSTSFDSMIFVTNDEDKAILMQAVSSGSLHLSPFKGAVDQNEKKYSGWKKWVEA